MTSEPLHDLAARLRHLADPAGPGVPDAELLRRFADGRDEAAFELLVWRHGGMVLAACRRVLGRSADADDAFQATFLALVRRAGAVRRGGALAGWLHRVAVRAALRLRGPAARRAAGGAVPEPAAPPDPPPDDTAAVLDEEIARLPEKLRVAFVLCHLEGRTNEEAAERLGCPKGTVLSRLSRARERLRDRLARRGLGAPAAGLAALPAPPPAALVGGAVRAAGPFAAGRAAGVVPSHVLTLTHGVLRAMRLNELKPFAALAAAAALAAGAVFAARPDPPAAPPPRPSAAQPPAAVPPAQPAPRELTLATADHGVHRVHAVRFSPDGRWVVTTGLTFSPIRKSVARAVVWDAATGKHAHTCTEAGSGSAFDFSPDGKTLAVAGGGVVTLWQVGGWKKLATLQHLMVAQVGFAPGGKVLVTRSHALFDGKTVSEVKVWDAAGEALYEVATGAGEAFGSAAFSPDGGTLALGTTPGAVRLLDARTGRDTGAVRIPEKRAVNAVFSPDGKRLLTWPAAGGAPPDGGVVRAWDPATGKEVLAFEKLDHPVTFAAFSPDGKRVVAAGESPAARVWDAATGERVADVRLGDRGRGWMVDAAFTPAGGHLAVVWQEWTGTSLAPTAALLSLPGAKETARLPGGVKGLALDPAGKAVALVTGAARPTSEDPPDVVTVRDLAGLLNPAR